MTEKDKLEKIKKLADAMYYAAGNLGPNVGSGERLRKTMKEYYKFIIHEYNKEEPNFKVGDTIRNVDGDVRTVVEVGADCYKLDDCSILHFNAQDKWEEECNITGIKSRRATGKLKECIDNQTEEGLEQARKQLEKNPQECMYARGNYTDEDRKVLCDGCEEKCEYAQKEADWLQELHCKLDSLSKEDFEKVWAKYHQKEEPVSEDFETALEKKVREAQDWTYIEEEGGECPLNEEFGAYDLEEFARWGADWVRNNEKEPVSKELTDEIKSWLKQWSENEMEWSREDIWDTAEHFANWQKQQDSISAKNLEELISTLSKRYPEVSFAKLSRIVVRVAKWQKQQMIKDAADGVITFDYYKDDKAYGCVAHNSFCLEERGLRDCDKVKIIVVKED